MDPNDLCVDNDGTQTCTCQRKAPCTRGCDTCDIGAVDTARVTVYFIPQTSHLTVIRHDKHGNRQTTTVSAGTEIVTNLAYQISKRDSCITPCRDASGAPCPPTPSGIAAPPPPPPHQCALFKTQSGSTSPSQSPLPSLNQWDPQQPASCPNVQTNPVNAIKSTEQITNVLNAVLSESIVSQATIVSQVSAPCHEVSNYRLHVCPPRAVSRTE
eukprot:COSAG01_NODE_534_length_15805_cov_9.468420_9_plen_213_part_00